MKLIITLLAITFSLNSFASQITLVPTLGTTVLSHISSGGKGWKKDNVEKKVAEYYQDGTLSPEIAETVREIQEIYEVSETEAVEMLLDMLGK